MLRRTKNCRTPRRLAQDRVAKFCAVRSGFLGHATDSVALPGSSTEQPVVCRTQPAREGPVAASGIVLCAARTLGCAFRGHIVQAFDQPQGVGAQTSVCAAVHPNFVKRARDHLQSHELEETLSRASPVLRTSPMAAA